jgi:hypothetical protein
MKLRTDCTAGTAALALALVMTTAIVSAQAPPLLEPPKTGAPVVLDKRTLFSIYGSVGSFEPADRARVVGSRLTRLADNASISLDSMALAERERLCDSKATKRRHRVVSVSGTEKPFSSPMMAAISRLRLLRSMTARTISSRARPVNSLLRRPLRCQQPHRTAPLQRRVPYPLRTAAYAAGTVSRCRQRRTLP